MMPIRLTKNIKILLGLYLGIFIVQQSVDQFFGGNLLGWFSLIPAKFVMDLWIWQIFTYAFLHADVMHLFLNMLMLAFIGAELDALWGSRSFLKYYFFSSIFAGACYLLMQLFITSGLYSPMVGASGGIYALLIAYGLIFGERQMLFLLLFPMKAKHFVWILAGVEFMTMVFSPTGSKFSAVAHLGGMLGGFLYLWFQAARRIRARERQAQPSGRSGSGGWSFLKGSRKKQAKHLKLVVNRPGEESDLKSFTQDDDDDDRNNGPKTWH